MSRCTASLSCWRCASIVITLSIVVTIAAQAQIPPSKPASVPIAPVVNYAAVPGGDGDFQTSRLLCAQNGGFLPAESTKEHHEQVAQAAQQVATGTQWFAYLGGSSDINNTRSCNIDVITAAAKNVQTTPMRSCLFRWNQGRWLTLTEPMSMPLINLDLPNAGISFYKGSYYKSPGQDGPQVNNMPSYFLNDASDDLNSRPNLLFGQYLVAVSQESGSTWSDNVPSGGYAYQNWKGGTQTTLPSVMFDAAAMQSSRSMFVTVCQIQTFDRATYEQYNTTSGLQEKWWIIFLVIFFVICLVGFVVAAACQEREDMDEPPEDAPEWAEEQNAHVKRSGSFVSARSLRAYNDTTADNDNGSMYNASRQGSMYSASRQGSVRSMSRQGSVRSASRQGSVYSNNSRLQHQNSGYSNPLQPNDMMQRAPSGQQNNWMQ